MIKAILQTNNKSLMHRNGEEIDVISRLPRDDFDIDCMYKVKFKDGYETVIYEKEFREE